jgi:hypothetical protein
VTDASPGDEIEAVRARLLERGLLATQRTGPPPPNAFPTVRARPRAVEWDEIETVMRTTTVRAKPGIVATPARPRNRRRVILAVTASLALLVVVAVGLIHAAAPNAATGASSTCAHFDRLRRDMANGSMNVATVRREIIALERESASATAAIARAFADLRKAGDPGSPSFLFARTAAADACTHIPPSL